MDLGRLRQLDAAMRIEAAVQPQAEFWQGAHFTRPIMEFARGAAGLPPVGAWTRSRGMDKIVSGINRPQPSTLDLMPTEPTRRNVLALLGSLVPAAAWGAYPDRPVKLVVALAPGGPADTAARVFAPYFAEQIGQNVVIENRTGA